MEKMGQWREMWVGGGRGGLVEGQQGQRGNTKRHTGRRRCGVGAAVGGTTRVPPWVAPPLDKYAHIGSCKPFNRAHGPAMQSGIYGTLIVQRPHTTEQQQHAVKHYDGRHRSHTPSPPLQPSCLSYPPPATPRSRSRQGGRPCHPPEPPPQPGQRCTHGATAAPPPVHATADNVAPPPRPARPRRLVGAAAPRHSALAPPHMPRAPAAPHTDHHPCPVAPRVAKLPAVTVAALEPGMTRPQARAQPSSPIRSCRATPRPCGVVLLKRTPRTLLHCSAPLQPPPAHHPSPIRGAICSAPLITCTTTPTPTPTAPRNTPVMPTGVACPSPTCTAVEPQQMLPRLRRPPLSNRAAACPTPCPPACSAPLPHRHRCCTCPSV